MKAYRSRIGDLERLRSEVSTLETFRGVSEKTITPQYDVKVVDKKIVALQKDLFNLDAEVKKTNATVEFEVELNTDDLFAPIE